MINAMVSTKSLEPIAEKDGLLAGPAKEVSLQRRPGGRAQHVQRS